MLSQTLLTALATLAPVLGGVINFSIPSAEQVLSEIDSFVHPNALPAALTIHKNHYNQASGQIGKLCELRASGGDDTDNFVTAFQECGRNSIIRLPDEI